MVAGVYNLVIEQGSTFVKILTYKVNNQIVDLTNYTARMQLRSNIESSATVIELTTENGRISLGGVNGTITLTISATDTANLDDTNGVYDLEIVSSGGIVTRLLKGTFIIDGEVTR